MEQLERRAIETLIMASDEEVIDWDEAMQQCGDDEEFLRELLDDLRSETDTQMEKMAAVLKVSEESGDVFGPSTSSFYQSINLFIHSFIYNVGEMIMV